MIRIAISAAAFDAVSATLPAGQSSAEPCPAGGFYVWLPRPTLDAMDRFRRPGEGYSDVILRCANAERNL